MDKNFKMHVVLFMQAEIQTELYNQGETTQDLMGWHIKIMIHGIVQDEVCEALSSRWATSSACKKRGTCVGSIRRTRIGRLMRYTDKMCEKTQHDRDLPWVGIRPPLGDTKAKELMINCRVKHMIHVGGALLVETWS